MRAIKNDQIRVLERRRDFLQKRVDKRGEMKGGDYDLAEISALDVAIEYLNFIKTHDEIRAKIKTVDAYDNIESLANQLELF